MELEALMKEDVAVREEGGRGEEERVGAAGGGHHTDGLTCGLSRGFHPEPHMTDASSSLTTSGHAPGQTFRRS